MNIKPLYTIQVEEKLRIDAGDTIKLKGDSGVFDVYDYLENGFLICKFASCDDEGIWVEIGEDRANLIYFLFEEIQELEKM